MSVSLKEILEDAGYDFTTRSDAATLISWQTEFYDLVEEAEETLENFEEDSWE